MLPYLREDIGNLYKKIIVVGLYNSASFSKKERDYIFSYVSKKNNCDQCYIDHLPFEFNINTFDSNIINLVDKLISDSAYYDNTVDPQLLLQIKCIISFTHFANAMNNLR